VGDVGLYLLLLALLAASWLAPLVGIGFLVTDQDGRARRLVRQGTWAAAVLPGAGVAVSLVLVFVVSPFQEYGWLVGTVVLAAVLGWLAWLARGWLRRQRTD
jgi:4-amino-4-deoxy-L-arabinose transferase-like glycosyltransferase